MAKADFISVEQAGKVLGVQARQVRNLIKNGILPAQQIGRAYVISRIDLAKVPKVRSRGPKAKAKGK